MRIDIKKIMLRCLAGLFVIFFGVIGYSYFSEPVGTEGRVLGMIGMAACCLVSLHHLITGNRKFFFPKIEPLFSKKDVRKQDVE